MRYFAFIRPESAISRTWREHLRRSGHLDGVLFRWNTEAGRFEAGELEDEVVLETLRLRPDKAVVVEALGLMPDLKQHDSSTEEAATEEEADDEQQEEGEAEMSGDTPRFGRRPKRLRLTE